MPVATTLAVTAAAAAIKRIVDDLYIKAKELGVNTIGKARSDVKEVAIARALLEITKVKTLWNIDKEVSLYDFYYPSTVEFSEEIKKRINGIRDLGPIGHFVIQGTAGQGKSIFLRFLCGQELCPEQSSGRIPIFLELRRIRADLDINQLILQGLERFKLPATPLAWKALAESGKFILLLDAFDEIDPLLADRTVADIESPATLHRENLQIIVTSRPDSDIQKSNQFRVFKLAQLTASDHSPFLRKICSDKDQSESLLKVLKASPTDVTGLLTTPLMMTLLVILYKSLQTIPDTVPKFYEELFDVLFYRHDHSKPGFRRKRFTQLDDGSVKRLFSALCFFVRLQGLGVLTNEQLRECCEQPAQACSQPVDPDKFKSELIKTICLMQEDGFEISFIHKSVAQYYAASFVSRSSEEFANAFYELALKDPGWELELKFLSQIDTYRFNKLYELPLLLKVAADFEVSIDAPTASDAGKVSAYFVERMTVVAIDLEDENSPEEHRKRTKFLGWSGRNRNLNIDLDRDIKLSEFTAIWIMPVMNHLEAIKAPLPARKPAESPHQFIPVKHYRKLIHDVALEGGQKVIDRIRKRNAAAAEVIASESRKTAMLSAFLLPRKT